MHTLYCKNGPLSLYLQTLSFFIFQGIIAGIWPCSTITMIGELLGTESLLQVYGALHTFLFENEGNLNEWTYYVFVAHKACMLIGVVLMHA